jgi:hypothetical protein
MKKKTIIIGAGIAAVLLFILALAGFFIASRMKAEAKRALGAIETQLSIQLSNPVNGSKWPQDSGIPVQTIAQSESSIIKLQLWMDGALLSEKSLGHDENNSLVYTTWDWTPAAVGDHLLQARVQNANGDIGISNTIRITIKPPAGYNLLVPCQEGETVEQLIERSGVAPEIVYGANLDFDPQTPDQSCKEALIPVPPEEELAINNPVNIAPPTGLVIDPPQSKQELDDIPVPIQQKLFPPDSLPAAPVLYVQANGCDVDLIIEDRSDNETGFYIERWDQESNLSQRITDLAAHSSENAISYQDKKVPAGMMQYLVYAYNAAGVTPSMPAVIEIDGENCRPIETLEGGQDFSAQMPVIPLNADLAYFYYKIGSDYRRYPEGKGTFIEPGQIDSSYSLQSIITDLEIQHGGPLRAIRLWGWIGGKCEFLGQYDFPPLELKLSTCKDEKPCTPEEAMVFSAFGPYDNVRVRKVFWDISDAGWPEANEILWQISNKPFNKEVMYPGSLVDSWEEFLGESTNGYFEFDLKPYVAFTYGGDLDYYHSCWGSGCKDPTLYIRGIPMKFGQIVSEPSNPVFMIYEPVDPSIRHMMPSIYGVEIVNYTEPLVPNPKYWGCIFINGDYSHGICPPNLEEPGDFELLVTGIVDAVTSAWSYVIQVIDEAKNAVIDQVIKLGDLVAPGWCGGTCRGRLMAGLNVAITAFTGLPPNLPDFEKIVDSGIEYSIQIVAQEMGVPCEEDCQEIIRDGIKSAAEAIKTSNNTPSCNSVESERRGKQAWCPNYPEGTVVEPAMDGIYANAYMTVRISHYNEDGAPADASNYKLAIHSWIENTWMVDKGYKLCGYYDGDVTPKFMEKVQIKKSLIGPPFDTYETIPIPWIEPGKWVDIPVVLPARAYEIPGHTNKIRDVYGPSKWNSCIIDDWPYLYYGGDQKLTATILCENNGLFMPCMNTEQRCYQSVGNNRWEPCTSTYVREMRNPISPFWVDIP